MFISDLNSFDVEDFMYSRGMTRLWTDPTFNAVRNGAPHFLDQI